MDVFFFHRKAKNTERGFEQRTNEELVKTSDIVDPFDTSCGLGKNMLFCILFGFILNALRVSSCRVSSSFRRGAQESLVFLRERGVTRLAAVGLSFGAEIVLECAALAVCYSTCNMRIDFVFSCTRLVACF